MMIEKASTVEDFNTWLIENEYQLSYDSTIDILEAYLQFKSRSELMSMLAEALVEIYRLRQSIDEFEGEAL